MDEELRELIEIARIDAEFALLEVASGRSDLEAVRRHIEGVVVRLDEFLRRTHWSNDAGPRDRRN